MKRINAVLITILWAAAVVEQCGAITVDELGVGPAETVVVNVTGSGTLILDAGVLQLNVGGASMDAFCIDPFHFSDGLMSGYQVVGLTSAPKEHIMSADTALTIERLWGSYYSPGMSADDAAGLQIAFWELTGGSGFQLLSSNDYGAAGFLATVQSPNYNGPAADLVGLTGPGQDYAVQAAAVPEVASTFWLLVFSVLTCWIASWKVPRLVPVRARAPRKP